MRLIVFIKHYPLIGSNVYSTSRDFYALGFIVCGDFPKIFLEQLPLYKIGSWLIGSSRRPYRIRESWDIGFGTRYQ